MTWNEDTVMAGPRLMPPRQRKEPRIMQTEKTRVSFTFSGVSFIHTPSSTRCGSTRLTATNDARLDALFGVRTALREAMNAAMLVPERRRG